MAILDIDGLKLRFDARRVDQLSDDGDGPDEDIVSTAISDAEGLVLNWLSRNYTQAQIEADAGAGYLTAVVAMHNLESRRGDITDGVQRLYALALEMLEKLRSGDLKLAALEQVLPSISPGSLTRVYEGSTYFEGLVDSEDTDNG